MTRHEWLTSAVPGECFDPYEIWEEAGERKCRLYAVACARRIWHLLPDEPARRVVEALERLTEGDGDRSALEGAEDELLAGNMHEGLSEAQSMALSAVLGFSLDIEGRLATMAESYSLAAARGSAASPVSGTEQRRREAQITLDLMRELLSHLFRPADLPLPEMTPTLASLAAAAYDRRDLPSGHLDNTRLGVLADALEEAGCADAALLAHLRSQGPHVRGCWALDLVLGSG